MVNKIQDCRKSKLNNGYKLFSRYFHRGICNCPPKITFSSGEGKKLYQSGCGVHGKVRCRNSAFNNVFKKLEYSGELKLKAAEEYGIEAFYFLIWETFNCS